VELGFRTASGPGASGEPAGAEPAAYEWNTQHRGGRFQRRPEESLMLSGDQNMMEVTAAVHFRIGRAGDYLFRNVDTEALVRAAAESVLQSVTGSAPLEDALTLRRTGMEARAARELQRLLDRYRTGVEVHPVKLLEVHPSVEVVDAFRGVSGAYEEKIRLINEAEGYLGEQVALARGQAEARLQAAAAHSSGRTNRAAGDAARFTQFESAFRGSPEPNQTRLYLETMETILPGRRKLIVDTSRGRRHLLLADDGVEIGPGVAVPPSPPARRMEEERD
jgi:HflK protein